MKRIEFKPPPQLAIPEGKMAGDQFDRLATFRIKPNGDLCLVAIGDVQMPGYSDKKIAMPEMSNNAASRYRAAMSGNPLAGANSMGSAASGGGGY